MEFTAFLPWLALASFSCLAAQESVSDPVGFTTLDLPTGLSEVSISIVNPAILTSRVAATAGVSGNVITLGQGAPANVAPRFDPTKKYYLEITGAGAYDLGYVGDRFEVDVAATIASANNTLTVQTPSITNTMETVPNLSDYRLLVREHVTMFQVFGGLGKMLMKGSPSLTASDQVHFFDNATNLWVLYWLRSNAAATIVQWRHMDANDTTDYTHMPIPPGVGVYVHRQPSAGPLKLYHVGAIRTNPFRQPLPAGKSLLSHPVPVDHSITQRQMFRYNGFTGTASYSAADQIHILRSALLYDGYYYRANASGSVQEWRNVEQADTAPYHNVPDFFKANRSFFIKKMTADPEYIVQLP